MNLGGLNIYDIKLLEPGKNGFRHFVLFACHIKTIDGLVQELQDKVVISGLKLIWRKQDDELVVRDVLPFALSKHAIYSIALPSTKVVEYKD